MFDIIGSAIGDIFSSIDSLGGVLLVAFLVIVCVKGNQGSNGKSNRGGNSSSNTSSSN